MKQSSTAGIASPSNWLARCLAMTRNEGMTDERLSWHLHNWATWMRNRSNRLGYPSRASGHMGGSSSRDFDAMVADADSRCAAALDALIDDLPPMQRRAINVQHLHTRWRLPEPMTVYYLAACADLKKRLTSRGID